MASAAHLNRQAVSHLLAADPFVPGFSFLVATDDEGI